MKNGWQKKPLAEVCEVEYGTRVVQKRDGGTTYPVYGGGGATFAMDTFNREDRVVVVGRFGMSEQCTRFVPGRFFLNDSGLTLAPKNPASLLPQFLNNWTFSVNDEIFALGRGTAQKNLDVTAFRCMEVPLPPLPEQRRIVGILDEAFDGIATAKANAETNLHNAKGLFQSVLSAAVIGAITRKWREERSTENTNAYTDINRLFQQIETAGRKASRSEETAGHELITNSIPKEWQLASIDSLFNLIDYRGKNPPRSKAGRRLITAKNIKMGYLADEPRTFISEETYKKWMVRGFPKPGDILFVTEGHTMGFVALNTRDDDFALAQRTITLQPSIPFSARFFFYFMMSFYFQELVRLNATGAAAVGMKGSKFRSLPLPFPPIAEQQIIVAKLDDLLTETQRLESLYQRKLAALDELEKSLLEQAFSGQL